MTKKALLEYLSAVCDGEAAKYACEEAIGKLKAQFPENNGSHYYTYSPQNQSLIYPQKPPKPDIEIIRRAAGTPEEASDSIMGVGMGGCFVMPIVFIIICAVNGFFAYPYGWMMRLFWGAVSGILFFAVIFGLCAVINSNKKAEHEDNVQDKYRQALKTYEREMEAYQQNRTVIDTKRTTLTNIIAGYESTKASIEKKLNELYSRGVIHERFRNIIAVNQIREYLEMGVCDELEGANGAYALYFQDIRTEKICNSIHELQQALASSMNNLAMAQSRLVYEIRQTNSNLQALNNSISQSLDGIHSKMDGLSQSLPVLNAQLSSLNTHTRKIQDAVLTSAHNDYIVKRIQHMDDYEIRTRLTAPNA